ncbi:MAG: esterase/lipase family protein, partial [Nitrospinales bacterium]
MLIKNMSPNTTLVFFPGFLGFYKYGFSSLVISYFRNLEGILRDEGVEFLFPSPPQTGSVAERAESLSFAIKERTKGKLILIGHSMGGLDGRFLIHHLDPDHRVRALFTLSTPHHGTPVAPWILDTDGPFQFMVRSFGAKALREMTPDACRKRNQEIT